MSKEYNLYLKHMSATGGGGVCSWGDHLTLDAIANMYNIRVWCIESALSHECTRIGPLIKGVILNPRHLCGPHWGVALCVCSSQ